MPKPSQIELGSTAVAEVPKAQGAVQHAGEVSSLVRLAIDKGVDVAVLERLVALQERVTDRDAQLQLNQALAAFQADCPPIYKGRTANIVSKTKGTKFSYRYAPLDDIVRHIRPHLERHGLSYTWDSSVSDKLMHCKAIVRHVAGASLSASFSCPSDGSERMSAAQSAGAALTYARRQALVQALGLTTADEDTDGGAEPESVEPVSEFQLREVQELYDSVKLKVDFPKFLAFFEIEKMADLPAARFVEAKAMLERKR